jgi:hypothetical protein
VKTFGLAGLFALSMMGQSFETEMAADRPGFRNSTLLVGPGVVQIENGVSLSADRVLFAQPALRVGALAWLEFRLYADSVVFRSPAGTRRAGTSDLQAGIKFPLFTRRKGTRVVAIVKSTLPSGHSSQTAGGYEPGAELIWKQALTGALSLGGTWNLTRLKRERYVWQRAASLSASRSFGPRVEVFAEAYVLSPSEPGAGNRWYGNTGITRSVGNFLMLDAAAGHSVHGPRDWFVTMGFSFRNRAPRRDRK